MKAKIIVTLYIKNVAGALYTVNYCMSVSRTWLWGASLSSQSSLISCMHLLRHEHTCIPGVSRKW